MNENKENLRRDINHKLEGLDPQERRQKSQEITKRLGELEAFKRSRCVLLYVSLQKEVDTHDIIDQCLRTGKRVVVPRVDPSQGILEIREITSWDHQLKKGAFGIMEPVVEKTREVDLKEIDCVVVPGVAFDREGWRLGHGQGYYDKLLSQMEPTTQRIGLAFDVQLVEHLPHDPHDMRVHTVLAA